MVAQRLVQQWDRLCREDLEIMAKPTANHRMVMKLYPKMKDAGLHTMLDVGCGDGRLMREFEILGLDVKGTEIVPTLFQHLKGLSVFPVPVCDISKNFTPGSFDLVLFVDVSECLDGVDAIDKAIEEMWSIASKCLVVTTGCAGKFLQTAMTFAWWGDRIKLLGGDVDIFRDLRVGADLFCVWK